MTPQHYVTFGLVVIACLLSGCMDPPRSPQFNLQVVTRQERVRVEVTSDDPNAFASLQQRSPSQQQWESILSLHLENARVPVLGDYNVTSGTLTFQPRYALTPGASYRAAFNPKEVASNASPSPLAKRFTLPKPDTKSRAVVERIYPTTSALSSNHLKFYIYFSRPIRENDVRERGVFDLIHLLDANEKEIKEPFRETELWSKDRQRLTLWIHPGRVKEGVLLREEMGPVLQPQQTYTLVIDKNIKDEDGNPLAAPFRKTFTATADDHTQPDFNQWHIAAPAASTLESLTLSFPEPLDSALLQHMIWIETADGKRVAGKVVVDDEEKRWRFVPKAAWQAGSYRVVVNTLLEDLAGNSLQRPFEVQLDAPPPRAMPATLARTFTIRGN